MYEFIFPPVEGSLFSTPSPGFIVYRFFWWCHSDWCEAYLIYFWFALIFYQVYILPNVQQIASRKLLYNMGSSASRGRIVGSGGRLKREVNFILQLFSEHSKYYLAESLKWWQVLIILKRCSSFQLHKEFAKESTHIFTHSRAFLVST